MSLVTQLLPAQNLLYRSKNKTVGLLKAVGLDSILKSCARPCFHSAGGTGISQELGNTDRFCFLFSFTGVVSKRSQHINVASTVPECKLLAGQAH